MGTKDYRTKPLKDCTFYVFENLNFSIDHAGGDLWRFDGAQAAVKAYQGIQKEHNEWMSALGVSIGGGLRELDLIQRRSGENCLITDYLNIEDFRESGDVQEAIELVLYELGVDWQVDHELANASILVPCEFGEQVGGFSQRDIKLMPVETRDTATSVQEAYVVGEGWMGADELRHMSTRRNDEKLRPPKVTGFMVSYEICGQTENATGIIGVSPIELRSLVRDYRANLREQSSLNEEKGRPDRAYLEKSSWREMIDEARKAACSQAQENAKDCHNSREDGR